MCLVTNIQKYSIHDGDGIRTTVFLKGCPLRCKWCQNPEGLFTKKRLLYFKNSCIHCQRCKQFAIEKQMIYKNDRPYFNPETQEWKLSKALQDEIINRTEQSFN